VLVCLAAWLGLQHLGYSEFGVAKRMVLGGTIRSVLSAQLALEAFELEVNANLTLGQCRDVLCRTYPQFGFSGVEFKVDDVKGHWGVKTGWQVRIDFAGHGYINVWREAGATSRGAAAVLFIDCVSRTFSEKLSSLELANHE
jgi:hypothetical protein